MSRIEKFEIIFERRTFTYFNKADVNAKLSELYMSFSEKREPYAWLHTYRNNGVMVNYKIYYDSIRNIFIFNYYEDDDDDGMLEITDIYERMEDL